MLDGRLSFRRRLTSTGGTVLCAVLLAGLSPQVPATTLRGAARPAPAIAPPMVQISDDVAAGGPAGFADLAEKVQPAVIGVVAKVAASQSMRGQGFKLGSPDDDDAQDPRDQQDQQDQEIPMPGPGAPDHGDGPKAKPHQAMTIGSGFFISPDGYAVTNSHVVEDSDTAEIRTNDDKTYTAKIIGKDAMSDLALIKVDGRNDFSYVKLADRQPRTGEWVLTVGNPFGLGGTVTAGIVSARERTIEGASSEALLQIDAPINKGDSGGPSFNTRGEVIGVNSMIFSPSGGSVGVAFAVPADTVKAVIPQLKDHGKVTRGWMGAELQSVTPELADGLGANGLQGAIIANVQRNSPAARAGVATGDVVTSASGEPVKNANELARKVQRMAPGSEVRLGLLRKGQESAVSVTLGQMPEQTTVGSAASQK
jgi:serine protease Do